MTTRQSPRTLPRVVWDDDWKAPPAPRRLRATIVGASVGIGLLAACIAFLTSSNGVGAPATSPTVVHSPRQRSVITSDVRPATTSRVERFEPEEIEVTEWSQPPRRPAAQPVVAPPVTRWLSPRLAPPASARVGFLSVNSTPWAELSVDGRVVGSTPQIRIRVTPGRHRLLLVRDGFQPHSAWVDVSAGATVRVTDIALKASSQ